MLEASGPEGQRARTHGPELAQNPNDQESLQGEEDHQTDEREEQVQHVERDIAIVGCRVGGEFAGPVEARIQCDVSRSDEEDQGGGDTETDRNRGAVVEELKPDEGVQQQDPTSCGDRGDMRGGEALSNGVVQRETADAENLTNLNDDEGEQEQLHFPVAKLV